MRRHLPRGSLSRSELLDTALAIVDRSGLDSLTVRGLARELGRPPMSLYVHFTSRKQLVELVFERLVEKLLITHRRGSWRHELEASGRHAHRILRVHPHWIPLLTRVHVPATTVGIYDHLLELLRKDGFSPQVAMFAVSAIISHALGAALVERMLGGPRPIPRQRLALIKGMAARAPRGTYPAITRAAATFDRWSFDGVFEVGLHALIDGLESLAPRRQRARRAVR